ncbi:MAG: UPF0182 family protein [Candidatus Aenigmarchaeota archaeon]|nr:UPF0182 family protein [Candidatus Aenigmarchaeota archaeon]
MRYGSIIVLVIIILLGLFSALLGIFGEWFWFASLGYESVFLTMLCTSIGLGVLFGLGFLAFSLVNLKVARRIALKKSRRKKSGGVVFYIIAAFIALFVGVGFSSWEVFLKFMNPTSFGVLDPVFGLDIGFYAFTLPFYGMILTYLAMLIVPTMLLVWGAHIYYSLPSRLTDMGIEMEEGSGSKPFEGMMTKKALTHLSILAGILLLVIGLGFYLAQFSLLFSETGVVYGAGYMDLNVILPLLQVMLFISVITGLVFLAGSRSKRLKPRMIMLGIFLVVLVLGFGAAGLVQLFMVSPDEFNMESPYIERNIQNTLAAYGLQDIDESMFPISYNLTKQDIENNPGTIGNIRLWDWRPLIATYNQLQLFRTYYEFNDVDIDRYDINGNYKQVMVSAREMDIWDLPPKAQTWVNQHLTYTHGYGAVMNPVDRVSNGLPVFYIKDIPPESQYFDINRPEIYYGEGISEYAVIDTTTEELDYPSGEQNIYTTYTGSGGVELSDFFRRLVYAAKYGSIELLVSGSIKPESKILMHRDIKSRIDTIAPFIWYDHDPYIVVSEGRLYWIIDAYTITNAYPYSEPIYTTSGWGFNYIRNSVKVVVDAYSGDVTYYVIDREDPVINTYMKIFPDLFQDFSQMPADLQKHIRYPEDLFRIQAELYSIYHMKDPRVFYNKEDAWVIPEEIYREGRQEMIPYYIIMKLPGEEKEEFILMIPFIPRGKENLIGWMAARCDSPGYGNLVVFQFSKQVLTYGPMQIEARIDQDTEISQRITLWSQAGSNVIRGNTLIIPIENSILYIEPLYLEATEKGTLPELKRVIVVYENQVTMQETLDQALEEIFGDISIPSGPSPPTGLTDREKLGKIAELFNKAQDALKTGDLAGYQNYINQIGQLVK